MGNPAKKGEAGEIDVCSQDEAGFAMTLPTCYSWFPIGKVLRIPYEAPQGRRVNAIGAYFSHGPETGRFEFATYARLPKNRAKKQRKTPEQIAAAQGLLPEEVGPIDSRRFLAFVWRIAGRPTVYAPDWKRERPLWMVLDNYSVHTSQPVQEAIPELEAANVFFFYLPSYSPELSEIEPIWKALKHHEIPVRSHSQVKDLKAAVDAALTRKAEALLAAQPETKNELRAAA
ncbi:MAG TPA: transposase [Chthonomonadaceae bacterium]|nr:transposase [Chthonomonadaceae bacterium]